MRTCGKIKHFFRTEFKKQSTILRLAVIIINTTNVIVYGLFFAYTLSDNYITLNDILETIDMREKQEPILDLIFRDKCLYQEQTLGIYSWPGNNPGCVCQIKELAKNAEGVIVESPLEALANGKYFLKPTCPTVGVQCLKRTTVPEHGQEWLYNWKNKKKLCA